MEHPFWFLVTISFACPLCEQRSIEKIVLNSPTAEVDKLRLKIDSQILACQKCKNLVPNGTPVAVEIGPPDTRESLEALGIRLPPLGK
jgi:hypothetical protein